MMIIHPRRHETGDFQKSNRLPNQAMKTLTLVYQSLTSETLIKIFQLADLLMLTPANATKLYLQHMAMASSSPINSKPAA